MTTSQYSPAPIRPATAQHHDETPLVIAGSRLLAGVPHDRPLSYAEHLGLTGALAYRDQGWLCEAAQRTALAGRGGAGFPVATKLAATRAGRATEVVVNGSESDPASYKDRTLMRRAPHTVIDGALVAAAALRTEKVTIAVHDHSSATVLAAACRERPDAGPVQVAVTPGGFVSGEVRALIRALDGGPAVPEGRAALPTVRGRHGKPTFASNAETIAQIGALARLGVEGYGSLGTSQEPGTSLITLIGDVRRAGVAELPHGFDLELLTGPLRDRPILVGGYHGTWTNVSGLTLSRAALRARHSPLGAGVIAVLPPHTCALGEIARVASWLAEQSAQQCGPCMFGLSTMAHDLIAIHRGAKVDLAGVRRRIALVVGRGACANPDGAARFVASALEAFPEEVAAHRDGAGCGRPILGVLPVPRTVA